MSKADILRTEKFPYLLTILFALIGWGLTHSVDRLINSPIIEYKLTKEFTENRKQLVSYEITNISRDRLFQNIEFKLLHKRGSKGKLSQANSKTFPPMDLPEQVQFGAEYATITIPEFHPDWKFVLTVEMSEDFYPTLHFSSKNPAAGNRPIRLLRSGFETYIIKHELQIIVGLIALWLLTIVIYLAFIAKHNNAEPETKPCQVGSRGMGVENV